MSKYTTTMNEFITSELKRQGLSEFVNDGKLTFNNPEYAFIQKILFYDEDVQKIVDDKIFKGFKFKDDATDKSFKEVFVSRFLDREISRQTIEAFASQVLYVTLTHQEYIYTIFSSELEKYLQQHVTNHSEDEGNEDEKQNHNQTSKENENSTGNEKQKHDQNVQGDSYDQHREAQATLPQTEVNINVDNDELEFADTNTIYKDKNNNNQDTKGNQTTDTTDDSERTGEQKQDSDRNLDTNSKHSEITKSYYIQNLQQIYDLKTRVFEDYDRHCFLQIW